jgi:hypothetical protein
MTELATQTGRSRSPRRWRCKAQLQVGHSLETGQSTPDYSIGINFWYPVSGLIASTLYPEPFPFRTITDNDFLRSNQRFSELPVSTAKGRRHGPACVL